MRRAFMSTGWIEDEQGQVVGLSTGSDACSEHEWGIKNFRSALGVPQQFERGVADRVMTRVPTAHFQDYTLEDGTPAAWWILASSRYEAHVQGALSQGGAHMPHEHELGFYGKENLVCAWDEDGVMAHVRGAEDVERLRQLHEQALAKNLVLGGALLSEIQKRDTGGVILLQADRIDPAIAAEALEEDQSKMRLKEAATKLGIEQELREAGKRFFALSPRWKDKEEKEVIFWLNPMEQRDHHSGWFTVEQLREWKEGKGPVMIDKPLEAKRTQLAKRLDEVRHQIRRQKLETPWMHVQWKDETKSDVVVEVYYAHESKEGTKRAPVGTYDIAQLEAMYPKPVRAKPAAKKPKV